MSRTGGQGHWVVWVLVSVLAHGLWLLSGYESGGSAPPVPPAAALSLGLVYQPSPSPDPAPAPVEPLVKPEPAPALPTKPAPAVPSVTRAEPAVPPPLPPAVSAPGQSTATSTSAPPTPVARVEPAVAEPVITESPRYAEPPVRPSYPALARRRGWQGEVWLEVAVGPEGNSADPVLLRSSGFELLDKAALDVARQWRFIPEQRNGQPVATRVRIPVQFALR